MDAISGPLCLGCPCGSLDLDEPFQGRATFPSTTIVRRFLQKKFYQDASSSDAQRCSFQVGWAAHPCATHKSVVIDLFCIVEVDDSTPQRFYGQQHFYQVQQAACGTPIGSISRLLGSTLEYLTASYTYFILRVRTPIAPVTMGLAQCGRGSPRNGTFTAESRPTESAASHWSLVARH